MSAVLSQSQARRIALKAQGLASVRPTQPVTARRVGRTFAQLQLVQIDSVNIVSRSHFLPFFSRLGSYDPAILSTLSSTAPRKMMEYWAHEASFIRPQHFHDLRLWQNRTWVGSDAMEPQLRQSLEPEILELLAHSGPLTAREVKVRIGHEEQKSTDAWGWNWSAVKRSLEGMFERGIVGAASRNEQFERRYALVGKILPPDLVTEAQSYESHQDADGYPRSGHEDVRRGTEPKESAIDRLIDAAARAHGIGSTKCLADYFRLPVRETGSAIARLVAAGSLQEVAVAGWKGPTYLHSEASIPRKAVGRALLSPFDSLVFERNRLESLFNFHYRLEIYTPAHKRKYGYYVLPFLLGETMAARVDLKADRHNGLLLVRGAYAEPDAPGETATELAAELVLMASWLGLGAVVVHPQGNLASALAREIDPL